METIYDILGNYGKQNEVVVTITYRKYYYERQNLHGLAYILQIMQLILAYAWVEMPYLENKSHEN